MTLEMRVMKAQSHLGNEEDLMKCVFNSEKTTTVMNSLRIDFPLRLRVLQGAFERRIERQRARREWEARRWGVVRRDIGIAVVM